MADDGPTFFSKAAHKFQEVPEDQKIVSKSFLDACSEIVPFFDILGATAFAPVKKDISGNINKLTVRLQSDPGKFITLHDMVNDEIERNVTKARNSATDALMWLKRALSFLLVLLEQVLTGEQDLAKCATKAYEDTLKKYHGWMVQKVFQLAMKAVPYRETFIQKLGPEASANKVLADMKSTVEMMKVNIDNLNEFYIKTNQEVNAKV